MKHHPRTKVVAFVLAASLVLSPFVVSAQTSGTSTAALIAALQAQLAALQAQITALRSDVTTTQSDVVELKKELKLLRILKKGMKGDDVKELQEYLAQFPDLYPEGSVTGYFGSKTEQAVKRFQEKQGVVSGGNSAATGYGQVGPKTLAKLNEVFKKEKDRSDDGVGARVREREKEHEDEHHGSNTGTSTGTTTPSNVEHVTICHIPPGNPYAMSTIIIDSPALNAHLAHGDTKGACPVSGGGGGGGGGNPPPPPPPPPPADTTAPSVSITSPINGATASGTVSVSATASDNVGVVGVQFKLDGVNLGSEDTAAPYSVSWDTTVSTNASHTLTAVARDAAGNSTLSMVVSVVVNNSAPDATAPSLSITSPINGATASGTVSVSATASDNVGVVGVQFKLDGANLGGEDPAAPYSVSWDTTVSTNASHILTAVARDAAGNSTSSSVQVSVNNAPVVYTMTFNSAPGSGQILERYETTWAGAHDSTNGYQVHLGSTGADNQSAEGGYYPAPVGYLYEIYRAFLPIDTSGLPDNAIVTGATLYLLSNHHDLTSNEPQTYFTLVGPTTQASATTLTTDDFEQTSGTIISTKIVTGSEQWAVAGNKIYPPTAFPFNSAGLSMISKTGYTMIGAREGHDLENIVPTSGNGWNWIIQSNVTNSSQWPYLIVNYTLP